MLELPSGPVRSDRSGDQPRSADEFQYYQFDNFLSEAEAERVAAEFPRVDSSYWINYLHYNERKFGLNKRDKIPPSILSTIDRLNGQEFLNFLEELTGIEGLIADPALEGGGLHQTPCGGFLNIHADFTAHPHHRNWRRRVNVLIYFNKGWQEGYGGHLEFWTRDMKRMFARIAPVHNRCVIFKTDSDAYHGHPEPLACPPDRARRSLALYYYTTETAPPQRLATNYRARPGEGIVKTCLITVDKKALALYSFIKATFGIDDAFISKRLRYFSIRKKK